MRRDALRGPLEIGRTTVGVVVEAKHEGQMRVVEHVAQPQLCDRRIDRRPGDDRAHRLAPPGEAARRIGIAVDGEGAAEYLDRRSGPVRDAGGRMHHQFARLAQFRCRQFDLIGQRPDHRSLPGTIDPQEHLQSSPASWPAFPR
ncbi:hypothetical protein [Nocardia caishijiensis]|uniref:hypothetical protein n=1 Tax=Nocardia caishijiensis TaxID=184756 RepID=UPI00082E20A6|nr:hypothetical protein [Nocardia caishijiensis]